MVHGGLAAQHTLGCNVLAFELWVLAQTLEDGRALYWWHFRDSSIKCTYLLIYFTTLDLND